MPSTLFIKNMVCDRCIKVVGEVFKKLSVPLGEIELGKVITKNKISEKQKEIIAKALEAEGFDLIEDRRHRMIEDIKKAIIQLIQSEDLSGRTYNFSSYLADKLHKDYHYLSSLFSEIENVTIEQYIILQKTEKVKELLLYDELNLEEISFRLGYSSSAHLSGQFKKVTGFSPTQFKQLKDHRRKPLDKLK